MRREGQREGQERDGERDEREMDRERESALASLAFSDRQRQADRTQKTAASRHRNIRRGGK